MGNYESLVKLRKKVNATKNKPVAAKAKENKPKTEEVVGETATADKKGKK